MVVVDNASYALAKADFDMVYALDFEQHVQITKWILPERFSK